MTTTIAPSSGAGVLFTQQGVGTTPGYSALDLRRSEAGSVQEGVYGLGASAQDFMAQQRIAGANMQVEITMPAGGMAAVQGDTVNGQGLYDVPVHSANILETIGTADPTNPRVDQIILEVQDNVLDASGGNQARTRVVAGTPTGGTNLTTRAGAAALPGSALLLADVLVGAAVGSITNSVIRDRRKFARGAYKTAVRASTSLSTASTTTVALDTATFAARLECSGVPLRCVLSGDHTNTSATQGNTFFLQVDAAAQASRTDVLATASATGQPIHFEYVFTPAAGSHLFDWNWLTTAGTAGAVATAAVPLLVSYEELIRQNVANNTVTSG